MKIANTFSIKNDTRPSDNDIRSVVPSIFAESPADTVSDRYRFVSTSRIIDIMREDDYEVVQARGGLRARSRTHGIHEVRMRKIGQQVKLHEVFPEVVLINSHDGTSSAILHMGLFRQVCSNGLVVGERFQQPYRVPHIGDPREGVIAAARRIIDTAPVVCENIIKWRERMLKRPEIEEFGRRAIELRKLSSTLIIDPDSPRSVSAPRRESDYEDNLWNVFNRTQENLVRGGLSTQTATGRNSRTRGIRAVKTLVDLNKGLWDLAEEFLPN